MISKKAKIAEKLLSGTNFKRISSKKMYSFVRKEKNSRPPKQFYRKYKIKEFRINEMGCYSIYPDNHTNKHIMYFHGGAYTVQASIFHWKLIDKILKSTSAIITFVDYPLAPESQCIDTLKSVEEAYKHVFSNEHEVVLIGDSAGGGLALALSILIKKQNISPRPSKVVLLSAWLDVSMKGADYLNLSNKDYILDEKALEEIGKLYAGDLDTADYRCSPLYGDLTDIDDIAIFTGTSDMLSIQSKKLKDKLEKNNGRVVYNEYESMQHVWMMFPIPEALDAINKVCNFIIS